MLKMLRQESIPYLFVALIGIFTWSLNNIIENTKQSPIVEYAFKKKGKSNKLLLINNLSSSNMLMALNFKVCSEDSLVHGNTFTNIKIKAEPPAYVSVKNVEPNSISGQCFGFIVEKIQPNSKYIIEYKTKNTNKDKLQLTSSQGGQPVRIIKRNWFTFSIRNQFTINIFIIVTSLVLILGYSFYLKNTEK